jgi:CRP-like cAMP-binding protein
MGMPRREIAPQLVAEGRRLYEQTMTPTYDIAVMLGIARSTFNNRVNEWGWTKRAVNRAAVDIARIVRGSAVAALTAPPQEAAPAPPAERHAALAARILDVVEREMDAVEAVLKQLGPADKAEAERSARTLASLARTMHEIAALAKPDDVTPPDDPDTDPVPRDIDELRVELARRIRGLVEAQREREGAGSGGAAGDVA